MQKFRTTVALATALALVGCQTLDGVTVNGSALNNTSIKKAQAWGCGWACAVGLGVAGAVVIGLAVGGGGGGYGGGNSGGSGGSGGSAGSGGFLSATGPGSGAGDWDY
jgi:hypothetical protein